MAQRSLEEIAVDDRRIIYRLDNIFHVAHNINTEFVCLPYRTDAIEAVVHPSILQADHRALWTSIVPLIYFGTIKWHQVDLVIPQFGGV
ncbi:hypothetical protein PIB30_078076 [Stylosanthes scabra]|uniref:Uncharacterized protein n=1 Tax=Stylosanthes scabra TaxID=79078 RepID=A0ABU6XP52_9FABA|nr:hypothetical protein [Stylosanthes scabra]